jgi:hypothetical protein
MIASLASCWIFGFHVVVCVFAWGDSAERLVVKYLYSSLIISSKCFQQIVPPSNRAQTNIVGVPFQRKKHASIEGSKLQAKLS